MDAETGGLKGQSKYYSLVQLMSKCSDFTNQKSDIEELVSKLVVLTAITLISYSPPNYKLLGEGIEYY